MGVFRLGVAALTVLGLAGCTAPSQPVSVGRAAFTENCSSCHGAQGRGDGPMSVFVSTGVPNLRQLRQRSGGEFPKTYVIEVVTRISDLHDDIVAMPDFGTLLGASPTVYMAADGQRIKTDSTILAIVDYLESVQD